MSAPSEAAILDVIDVATPRPDAERALALLTMAAPELSRERQAALAIGEMDRRLIELRRSLFGDRLAAVASCPACGAALESNFTCADLLALESPAPAPPCRVELDGCRVSARLPRAADLVAIAHGADVADAKRALLSLCVDEAVRNGQAVEIDALPASVVAALGDVILAADPLAEISLDLVCPDCGTASSLPFDAGRFLWAELREHARRLVFDVHVLAQAYGWREADILALTPTRRAAYLHWLGA